MIETFPGFPDAPTSVSASRDRPKAIQAGAGTVHVGYSPEESVTLDTGKRALLQRDAQLRSGSGGATVLLKSLEGEQIEDEQAALDNTTF